MPKFENLSLVIYSTRMTRITLIFTDLSVLIRVISVIPMVLNCKKLQPVKFPVIKV